MIRSARTAVLAALVVAVALHPVVASASGNVAANPVGQSHPTSWWPLGDAPPTSTHTGGLFAEAVTNSHPACTDLQGNMNAGTGPFAGDVNPASVRLTGPSQLTVDTDPTCPVGSHALPATWAMSVWVKYESVGNNAQSNILSTNRTYGSGCNCTFDQTGALYVNTGDGSTLCWGQVGGPGACHSYPDRGASWQMFTILYDDDAHTITFFIGGYLYGVLTGATHPTTPGGQLWVGGKSDLSSQTAAFWGLTTWQGSAAKQLLMPCGAPGNSLCAGPGATCDQTTVLCTYIAFIYLGTASGNDVPNTAPPLLPGTATGCATLGPLSHECKPLIPTLATNDCAAPGSLWNIGADIGYGLCQLGNVFIIALDAVITGLNYVVDLLEPGAGFLQSITDMWDTAKTHAPFAYAVNAISSLTDAWAAGPSALGTATIAGFHFDPSGFGELLAPYAGVVIGITWAVGVYGIFRMVKRDLAGEAG